MNQFGFVLGGPVYIPKVYKGTDKTFFFVDYQGTRWRQGSSFFTTVPTVQQRQGDFSKTMTAFMLHTQKTCVEPICWV
jgi:hypothetical protein